MRKKYVSTTWQHIIALLFLLTLNLSIHQLQRVFATPQLLDQLIVDHALYDIAWSPNGELLAVAFDNGIGIYTESLQEIAQLPTENIVSQISWSADSNQFASIGLNDPTVKIWRWDVSSNTFVLDRTLTNSHGYSFVHALAWSPNGDWLAIFAEYQPPGAAYIIGTTEIWDTETWTLRNSMQDEHQFATRFLQWNSESSQITGAASVCPASEFFSCGIPYFYIVDTTTGELTYTSLVIFNDLHSLAWSSNNKLAVADEEQILIFDPTIHQTVAIYENETPDGYGTLNLDWSLNGENLVTAYFRSGLIEIIDVERGTTLLQFSTGGLNGVDLSPDDSKLATINSNTSAIQIWDVSQLADTDSASTVTPVPTLTPSITPTGA